MRNTPVKQRAANKPVDTNIPDYKKNPDDYKFNDEYYVVRQLIARYGSLAKLIDIVDKHKPLGFKCPECKGKGTIKEKYATDMLAVATGCADWSYHDVECKLCHGTGAVPKKMKPHMVQDGWEEA